MRLTLAVPLMLLYIVAVMITSGHLHYDLKSHPNCVLCELSKAVAVADTVAMVTAVDHLSTIPVPVDDSRSSRSYPNVVINYSLARAPPRWIDPEVTYFFRT